jgi:hypothetical protein
VRVECPRPPERAKPPHISKQLFLAEDPLRILGERDEQLVLLRRKLHRLTRDPDDARGKVDVELADGQASVCGPRCPPQDRTDARKQLLVHEGLDDIVITAAGKTANAVDRGAARADHDDRHVPVPGAAGLPLADPAADLEPGGVGEHRVEEDEVEPSRLRELERPSRAVGREDLEAVICELLREELPALFLVLDYEHCFPRHSGEASTGSDAPPDVLSDEIVPTIRQPSRPDRRLFLGAEAGMIAPWPGRSGSLPLRSRRASAGLFQRPERASVLNANAHVCRVLRRVQREPYRRGGNSRFRIRNGKDACR